MTNKYKYFLQSNFVGVNRLIVFFYTNQDVNAKTFKTRRYYLSSMENFYDQAKDWDIKR